MKDSMPRPKEGHVLKAVMRLPVASSKRMPAKKSVPDVIETATVKLKSAAAASEPADAGDTEENLIESMATIIQDAKVSILKKACLDSEISEGEIDEACDKDPYKIPEALAKLVVDGKRYQRHGKTVEAVEAIVEEKLFDDDITEKLRALLPKPKVVEESPNTNKAAEDLFQRVNALRISYSVEQLTEAAQNLLNVFEPGVTTQDLLKTFSSIERFLTHFLCKHDVGYNVLHEMLRKNTTSEGERSSGSHKEKAPRTSSAGA